MSFRWFTWAACLVSLLVSAPASADSPLTTTPFHTAYPEEPLVVQAEQQALMTEIAPEISAALRDPLVPSEVRAAIINAYGWQTNVGPEDQLDYIAAELGVSVDRVGLSDLTVEDALTLGYMLALADYSGLDPMGGPGEVQGADPHELLAIAAEGAPDDFTIQLIQSLTFSQEALHANRWCRVHRLIDHVVSNFGAPPNMRAEALAIIIGYIDSYLDYCPDAACPTFDTPGCCVQDSECGSGDACTAVSCHGPTGNCEPLAEPECCIDDGDCDDNDACTQDACPSAGQACVQTPVDGCCHEDTECPTGEFCVDNTCMAEAGTSGASDDEGSSSASADGSSGPPATTSGGDETGPHGDGGTAAADTDSAPPAAGGAQGCSIPTEPPPPAALMLLLALAVFRRRRPRF